MTDTEYLKIEYVNNTHVFMSFLQPRLGELLKRPLS